MLLGSPLIIEVIFEIYDKVTNFDSKCYHHLTKRIVEHYLVEHAPLSLKNYLTHYMLKTAVLEYSTDC